ncbi:alpha-2-macroglobulin-like protein 1 isoform X2 [Cololabis saira]|uniref:alpha-2-macroglobulin-like protein 1 isoform X2 n=1 Tax=Cololabis saira TaxID=129043 RepID=UPI002AD30951|nr:alpha-2-macroglobulin-like protein 1 isoform X2 [Cololabis saira]
MMMMMAPVLRGGALLLSVLVHAAAAASLNDTTFAVTISSSLIGGSQETLCALVQNLTEPVTLNIALEMEPTSGEIVDQSVKQDFYRCFKFQVPTVVRETVATVNVNIRGESGILNKKSKVLITPPSFIHIVQTDKPIYKPGQTVQFRIVSMDTSFIPVDRVYKEVTLTDPSSNRIAQWLDKAIVNGILDLAHPTIPEADQGSYQITAMTDKGEMIYHQFDIKEYVLPTFEVNVHLPEVITILDKDATMRICGKYTYGKPVLGSVRAEFCRRTFRYYWISPSDEGDVCKTFLLKTDTSGCAKQVVDLADFHLHKRRYDDNFHVSAELVEDGTGVILKGSGKTTFTSQMRTVTFQDVPEAYKPGLPFDGKVKMVGPDSKPVFNETIHLFVENNGTTELTFTTDLRGMALFSLDTSLWTDRISLTAHSKSTLDHGPYDYEVRKPDYDRAFHSITQFYSKSRSFLKLLQVGEALACDRDAALQAQYIIQGEELKDGQETLDFFFLVVSRGAIVQHGSIPADVKAGKVNQGELTISLGQVTKLAPFAQVVVYTVMPGGEAVADSKDFPIQQCLSNKVSMKFSSVQTLPGSSVKLTLEAQPRSLCSVRAIDQSVLLLQPEKELTVEHVFNQLPVQKMSGYRYMIEDSDRYPCLPNRFPFVPEPVPELEPAPELELLPEVELKPVTEVVLELDVPPADKPRAKRSFYFPMNDKKDDVYSVFKEIGIKMITNSDVKRPIDCFPYGFAVPQVNFRSDNVQYASMPDGGGRGGNTKETIRKYFPETWIWDLVSIGDTGSTNVDKTVPDTITKWAGGAFCISPAGFGVAPNVGLTTFQPFFVRLTLPYSVIRGEVFTLKATVFNYLSSCVRVRVTLADSDQYTVKSCDDCLYEVCLCGDESRTFSWVVTPTEIGSASLKVSAEALDSVQLCGNEVVTVPDVGRIDTVIRTLLVEAEGTPQMVSHNALLCPKDGPVQKSISLQLPEEFIAGSARASVSVLGDLMGRAMKNLDKLLAMPYGCGEQNMVLFAPNIFILNYLKSTGQLTDAILTRAKNFLESGYQRELKYKHDDGSYSAFGKSDGSGNTWLTAFVMKSFGGARPYIFVDDKHINVARDWLTGLQKKDGCVASVGKLFHNGMKGGISDDVSLTAYVTAGLLELDGNTTVEGVQKGLGCLKAAVTEQMDNLYTTALFSYTFTLAGDEEMRSKLITYLHQKSTTEGGTRYWQRDGASKKGLDSLEVEMTSYVLLALLSGPVLPGFGLDYTTSIVRWLTQQQNPYGGFSSTQDTVVALQALAKYGAATYSPDGLTTVKVTSAGGLNLGFEVREDNRLLYQEEKLSEIPGEYVIRAEGQSCVVAQISMHYNIPPPADFSAFLISTSVEAKCNATRPVLRLSITVKYQGRRDETNMVLINVKLLSGYVLDKKSLDLLQRELSVKRVDAGEGLMDIYLDGLKKDETKTFSVTLEEDQKVRNLKAAVVKVYDYYQTGDEAVAEYNSPCAESDSANEL